MSVRTAWIKTVLRAAMRPGGVTHKKLLLARAIAPGGENVHVGNMPHVEMRVCSEMRRIKVSDEVAVIRPASLRKKEKRFFAAPADHVASAFADGCAESDRLSVRECASEYPVVSAHGCDSPGKHPCVNFCPAPAHASFLQYFTKTSVR